MNFFHSIKFRFTIWYLIVLGVLLILLSAGVYYGLSHSLHDNLDDSLKLRAEQLSNSKANIRDSISQGNFQEKLGEVVSLYFVSEDELIQVSAHGVEIPVDTQMIMNATKGKKAFASQKTSGGQKLRLYSVPYTIYEDSRFIPGGYRVFSEKHSGALVIGRSTENIDDALHGLRQILIFADLATLAIAGAGGIFLAKRALKPVDDIAGTAAEIEQSGDLSRRIKVDTKDELGRLASTLNNMIARLQGAFTRQQEFTGDASHELRTPLAVIEAESTLSLQKKRSSEEYKQSLEIVAQEAKHMSAIIGQLLVLARADAGNEQRLFEEVDLGELVRTVAFDAEILCREKNLKFECGQIGNLRINGNIERLRELFLNLVDNAVRYTPEGGTVTLSLERSKGKEAVVIFKDTGIGISSEEISHIFQRFYRIDKARSRAEGGSGLGLAICKHIAETHTGKIEVESESGKGSTFKVIFPMEGGRYVRSMQAQYNGLS